MTGPLSALARWAIGMLGLAIAIGVVDALVVDDSGVTALLWLLVPLVGLVSIFGILFGRTPGLRPATSYAAPGRRAAGGGALGVALPVALAAVALAEVVMFLGIEVSLPAGGVAVATVVALFFLARSATGRNLIEGGAVVALLWQAFAQHGLAFGVTVTILVVALIAGAVAFSLLGLTK